MTASLSGNFNVQSFADQGVPLVGGRLYTYAQGTTTQKDAFTDADGVTPHTYVSDGAGGQYIALNSRGELLAPLYLASGAYDIALKRYDGSTIWTRRAEGTGNGAADKVGYVDPVAPAYLKTVSDIINGMEVSAHRFLSSAQRADVSSRAMTLDLTAGLADAHATGVPIHYPRGAYKFSTLSMASGGITGEGKGATKLVSSDTTSSNVITYTGTGGDSAIPRFSDFALSASNTKAAGAGIGFSAASGELSYPEISGILIYNCPRGIDFKAVSKFHLSHSDILNYTDAGVFVANSNNIDSGDSSIIGCTLNTGQASGNRYGIYQESSAGLKVTGNKILGGTGGYVLAYKGNTQSGPLLLTGNSIENVAGYAIYLGHAANYSGIFGGIVLAGNEIAVCSNGLATDSSGAFVELTFASNYVNLNNSTGKHVALNGVDVFLVGDNTFVGGATAVDITSSCNRGKIGINSYSGQSVATVVNASATTFIGEVQSGTVASINSSMAYGPLFYGSAAVTFPTPFTVAPTGVVCDAGGAAGVAGGFGGYATNITKTGFTYNLVAVVSGATSGNKWTTVGGII